MYNHNHLFITGIGTGVGKTIAAAMLAQYLQADYWKPIQSGDLQLSDSMIVRSLIDKHLDIHPERYRFTLPVAPHQAAAAAGVSIRLSDFELPNSGRQLIVEGAGGLLVPINERYFMIDLLAKLQLPAALVVRDYLGCINHTLLSIRALQSMDVPIAYLLLNGIFNPATDQIIRKHIPATTKVLQLPEFTEVNKEHIHKASQGLKI